MGLLQILGVAFILLSLSDIFMTVLYARSGSGILTPRFNKLIWSAFKVAAPKSPGPRDAVLSFAGPSIMVLTAALWILLLVVGFALIVFPALGTSIQASQGATPTDFAAALYYSGYSLTTLGTGDLVPVTGAFRLLMIAEAAVGFSILTLTLTYFMSVYSALVRRNTLAQGLHHMSGGTGDGAEIVTRLGPGGAFTDARSQLSELSMRVLDLLEAHHSYPVLHYFRMRQPRYALARVSLLTMDTATLLKTAVGESHRDLSGSAGVEMLWGSGMTLLKDTGASFLARKSVRDAEQAVSGEGIAARYRDALRKLEAAGIESAAGGAGETAYVADRKQWEPLVRAFASSMAHRWDEIDTATSKGGEST